MCVQMRCLAVGRRMCFLGVGLTASVRAPSSVELPCLAPSLHLLTPLEPAHGMSHLAFSTSPPFLFFGVGSGKGGCGGGGGDSRAQSPGKNKW